MSNRKIIVYIATSADGYIARTDGSVEWLNRPRPKGNYGMGKFIESIDTIIWGRKTFGDPLETTKHLNSFGKHIQNYVFTHNPPPALSRLKVNFVNEPVNQFAARLRATPGRNIWIMGGAGIIASFLDAGEIDEFMIHVVPKLIGEGIPLIKPSQRNVALTLLSSTAFEDGVVRLHYSVLQNRER